MNEDKTPNFLFSTPIKPRQIKIYKRNKEEEQGDVYEQLSRILDDGSSREEKAESSDTRETFKEESVHLPHTQQVHSPTKGSSPDQALSLKSIIEEIETKEDGKEMSTNHLCSLLVERISKENSSRKQLEEDLERVRKGIKEKEEEHKHLEELVCELKQTNQDLLRTNTLLQGQLDVSVDMFSKYKEDINGIVQSLNQNLTVSIAENNRLSQENCTMKFNIQLIDFILKEECVVEKEELEEYVEEINKLHSLRSYSSSYKLFMIARDIFGMALGAVGDSVCLVEEEMCLVEGSVSLVDSVREKDKGVLLYTVERTREYYLGIIEGMSKGLEEYSYKIMEEYSRIENIYLTFKNEIKRLRKKMKKRLESSRRKESNRRKENRKEGSRKEGNRKRSSDSNIWDVFK